MNKLVIAALSASSLLLCSMASAEEVASAAPVSAASFPLRSGVSLKSADGRRLGFVDQITLNRAGQPVAAQVIVDQRIVHVPAATITPVDKSHFTTSLSYKDVTRL